MQQEERDRQEGLEKAERPLGEQLTLAPTPRLACFVRLIVSPAMCPACLYVCLRTEEAGGAAHSAEEGERKQPAVAL